MPSRSWICALIFWYVSSRSVTTSTKAVGLAAFTWAGSWLRSTSWLTDLNALLSAVTRALMSFTRLGWTPISTTARLSVIGLPAPSRILPRGPVLRATAKWSVAVMSAAKTAGDQVARHLSLLYDIGSVVW